MQEEMQEGMKDNQHPAQQQGLALSYARDGESYVGISYHKQDQAQVVSMMSQMQKRYGLRLYANETWEKSKPYWVEQMEENMAFPLSSVMLCFISKAYTSSYETLLELFHSQVGGEFGHPIPVVAVFLEEVPFGNDEAFYDYEMALTKPKQDTGLPSEGAERRLFYKLFRKMVPKLAERTSYPLRNAETVEGCVDHIQSLEEGSARRITTQFTYRVFKEVLNYLGCDGMKAYDHQGDMDSLCEALRERIEGVSVKHSPFAKVVGSFVAGREELEEVLEEVLEEGLATAAVSQLVQKMQEIHQLAEPSLDPQGAVLLDPDETYLPLMEEEYQLEGAVLLSVNTQKPLIILPEGVKVLGEGALRNLPRLVGVTFPSTLEELGAGCFWGDGQLKEVSLPEGVRVLKEDLFRDCGALETLVIPSTVERVEQEVFEGCDSLKRIYLGEGMTHLPKNLLASCDALEELVLPSTMLTVTYRNAQGELRSGLSEAPSLKSVWFGENMTSLPERSCSFCSKLEMVVLPSTLQSIGVGAFLHCEKLHFVVLPQAMTCLEEYTFEGCRSLTSVVIPRGVMEIDRSAFKNCSSLKEIVLPEGVTVVKDYTFEGCVSLEKVHLPSTLTKIRVGAFLNCKTLSHLNLSPSVEVMENGFRGCGGLPLQN